MGRKLNPEYREAMAERRTLPFCQVCRKRSRYGTHDKCRQDQFVMDQAAHEGITLNRSEVRFLRSLLREVGPLHSQRWVDDGLMKQGLIQVERREGTYVKEYHVIVLSEKGRSFATMKAPSL